MTSETLEPSKELGPDISQEELDFSDLFLYTPPDDDFPNKDGLLLHKHDQPPSLVVHHLSAELGPEASNKPPGTYSPATDHLSAMAAGFDLMSSTSRPGTIPTPSPRIEITPSGDSLSSHPLVSSPGSAALRFYRDQPCVSPASSNSSTGWPSEGYSPLASPCVSPNGGGSSLVSAAVDLCPSLQGIHTSSSPGASPRNSITDETFLLPQHQRASSPLPHPRSRSTSPQGKRTYDQTSNPSVGGTSVKQRSRSPSPIPSTHNQQGSCYPHHYQAVAEPLPQAPSLEEMLSSLSSSLPRPIPSNVVRVDEESCLYGPPIHRQDCVRGDAQGWRFEEDGGVRAGSEIKSETFYILSSVLPPPHPGPQAVFSNLPVAPFPSLEWPLPCQSGQYELVIQQQPRSHHRAHYETEGSRGAVKTPNGGHPEVQLLGYDAGHLGLQVFIGTADERVLRPHAFYQVHRVTGKTVTTPSMERMVNGTKVLEIPLEPKNHMRAMIDCAGILKLRNADIELRNGETDIGRKNTRVRLVFRVHIPQPGGQLLSLQVASNPIECSQRSAQELPAVERQDVDRYSVLGGTQMVLTGQNFTSDSKVIFSEKTQDGQQIWEVEATIDRDKTQPSMLFVEVPPYRDPTIYHPAKVNFYVINGKKKRSQPQHFTYTPLIAVKAEPLDDHFNLYDGLESQPHGPSPKSFYHQPDRRSNPRDLTVSQHPHHLTAAEAGAYGSSPHSLEDHMAYYPSRAIALQSSPVFYHDVNQLYGGSGMTHLSSSPTQRHNAGPQHCHYPPSLLAHVPFTPTSTSTSSRCEGASVPPAELQRASDGYQAMATFVQGDDLFEACLAPRHGVYVQTAVPLGKTAPLRYIQGQAMENPGTRADPDGQPASQKGQVTGHLGDLLPEKVTIKQENLNHAYLEDVNDIIRRDMKAHGGERS
ncbi:nuclear factor of activated T-cells, cytoplasmic 2-like [Lampris incognitus]|uniref:nuclear factor of activated T-cells, cytoplasmic 2-like n=1 Tax=Lampris incognitus TaxID=2546036 RepID=UPI0024B613E3|nr:nuclear factor of activated T-cells, cytoplasmic 2-like [Lampris incognitus]